MPNNFAGSGHCTLATHEKKPHQKVEKLHISRSFYARPYGSLKGQGGRLTAKTSFKLQVKILKKKSDVCHHGVWAMPHSSSESDNDTHRRESSDLHANPLFRPLWNEGNSLDRHLSTLNDSANFRRVSLSNRETWVFSPPPAPLPPPPLLYFVPQHSQINQTHAHTFSLLSLQ